MGDTDISWADKTHPIVVGCERTAAKGSKTSGCGDASGGGCYAERSVHRVNLFQLGSKRPAPYEDLVKLVERDGRQVPRWTGKAKFFPERLADPLRWRKPCGVFPASQGDLFHADITNEQLAAYFGVMAATPRHTYRVLTKRAARALDWFRWVERAAADCNDGVGMTVAAFCFCHAQRLANDGALAKGDVVATALAAAWPLPNVWIGTSTEHQAAADERIPLLLQMPAAIRWISAEPLIGPIDLSRAGLALGVGLADGSRWTGSRPILDWVVVGCESGPGARPCDVAWLRSIVAQCKAASVPVWLKQAEAQDLDRVAPDGQGGYFAPVAEGPGSHRKGGGVIELPYLDGVQHAAMPATPETP